MSATFGLHIDKRFTSLELIGGRYCDIGNDNIRPDLTVFGGAHIGGASVFDSLVFVKQDLTVEGNLTIIQNTYLTHIYATNIVSELVIADIVETGNILVPSTSNCLQITGNLCVTGTINFTPDIGGHWATPPTSLENAINRLASAVYTLNSNTPIA